MQLLSRLYKSFYVPNKGEAQTAFSNQHYLDAVLQKLKVFQLRKRFLHLYPYARLFGICAIVGSCVRFYHTKNMLCEGKISDDQYSKAIVESSDLIEKIKDEVGAPGIVVGVSVDGKVIWEEGFGYADVENRVHCTKDTVMRIASISKSLTMAAVAKLWEDGKLDLDKPIQDYVPHFPHKSFEGQPVILTCRHLVSHLGGIRHYDKKLLKPNAEKKNDKANPSKDAKDSKNMELKQAGNNTEGSESKSKTSKFASKEYYIKERYEDLKSALDLFKDDPLLLKPGTKYLYSTHGWTLVSAIVEKASKEQFPVHMKKLFKQLGMYHTYLDVNEALIYNRSRNYVKDKRGHLINAPYVDNSYKWAGGGFLSTIGDLLRFGNSMLYSLQYRPCTTNAPVNVTNNEGGQNLSENGNIQSEEKVEQSAEISPDKEIEAKNNQKCKRKLPGYLNYKTLQMMWTPIVNIKNDDWYGMGWIVCMDKQKCQFCEYQRFVACHSGGAIGASSVLLILPQTCDSSSTVQCEWSDPPKGVVVSIFANLQEVSLVHTAIQIAFLFDASSKGL